MMIITIGGVFLILYTKQEIYNARIQEFRNITAFRPLIIDYRTEDKIYKDFPTITLMFRTTGSSQLRRYQIYCLYLRTILLFWPSIYGNLAVVLDAEPKGDRKLGNALVKQIQKQYPEYNIQIFYESLPKRQSLLLHRFRDFGYSRQLYSTFFADLYSKESIIAYMDLDIFIRTPITKEYLFRNGKLIVRADGNLKLPHIRRWQTTTLKALGLPLVINFMVTFPQLLYKNTITKCREHIMKHLNTTDFEEAFSLFYGHGTSLSPICIILSYAWYFEKERYDWHFKIPDLASINKRLPEGHKVHLRHMDPLFQGVAHVGDDKGSHKELIVAGYCLSMKAQGNPSPKCKNVKHDLNTICDFHARVFSKPPWPFTNNWCKERNRHTCCQRIVDEHYESVFHMLRTGIHIVNSTKIKTLDIFSKEMGVTCEKLTLP